MNIKNNIIFLESVSSTNDFLKNAAKCGMKKNTVVIAQTQTSGKGTKGRSFISEKGGLYLSILVCPKLSGFDSTLITSATAVAVSETIDELCSEKSKIKWVNDVYIGTKKVCGILCESVLKPNGEMPFIVVGIGINLFKPQNGFDYEIENIADYLFEKEDNMLRKKFIDILLRKFFKYFEELSDKTFLPSYRAKNMVLGQKITVTENGYVYSAKALDIDEKCRLIVELPDKTQKILSSQDVSLKF